MQDITAFLNDNFTRFQTAKRSFKNDAGETVDYDQLQIVTGINETERVYDIKLSREAKYVLKADARNHETKRFNSEDR